MPSGEGTVRAREGLRSASLEERRVNAPGISAETECLFGARNARFRRERPGKGEVGVIENFQIIARAAEAGDGRILRHRRAPPQARGGTCLPGKPSG